MTLARSAIKEGSVTALIPIVESFCTRLTLYISPMCSSVEQQLLSAKEDSKATFIVLHWSTTRQVLGRLWWPCVASPSSMPTHLLFQSSEEVYHSLKLVSNVCSLRSALAFLNLPCSSEIRCV